MDIENSKFNKINGLEFGKSFRAPEAAAAKGDGLWVVGHVGLHAVRGKNVRGMVRPLTCRRAGGGIGSVRLGGYSVPKSSVSRREAADSAVARQGEATTTRMI